MIFNQEVCYQPNKTEVRMKTRLRVDELSLLSPPNFTILGTPGGCVPSKQESKQERGKCLSPRRGEGHLQGDGQGRSQDGSCVPGEGHWPGVVRRENIQRDLLLQGDGYAIIPDTYGYFERKL